MKETCGYLQVMDQSLKGQFHRLGIAIAKNPVHFITIPILLCLLLGTGLQRFSFVSDPEYLFSPVVGQARQERDVVDRLFPLNYSTRFDPSRLTKPGRTARIYITAKDGGSLKKKSVWKEIRELDELMRSVKIVDSEQELSFNDLCARWEDECFSWNILELGDMMDEIEAGNLSMTYPIMVSPGSFDSYFLPTSIGGVELDGESIVMNFKALQLMYFLDPQSPLKDLRGMKWENAIVEALDKAESSWNLIKVDRLTWSALGSEVDRNNFSAVPYMIYTVPLMIIFAAITCMMSDWVKSKPWLGIAGVICPIFGTLAAFGALSYCGIPLCSITIATPFLLLGIGIDDTFVMLGAWRQTRVKDPVPKRMAQAFEEAGVSITITSLTDMLSFWIGIATPFPSVQIFSVYTGTAVLGTYLCHIMIFGGAMAISGYHEAENRHGLLWWRHCIPKSQMDPSKSFFYRYFWTGGISHHDPDNPIDNHENCLMTFFRDRWAPFINKKMSKILILLLFIIYLGVSLWGISMTKEGLDLKKLVRYQKDSSYASRYFEVDDAYFREYPYRIQVIVEGDLDYSNKTVQDQIERMMQEFESSIYIGDGSLLSQSWLRGFLSLIDQYKQMDIELNVTNEEAFIESLVENYLSSSFILTDDIKFDENRTKIVASRFIIQAVNVSDTNADIDMVTQLRNIAAAQQPHLNVTIYNWYFVFFDQFMMIRSTTIQCVCIAAIIMMAISIIFIPNPLCSLWVTFSIVSIEAGVLGFLALWNVNLDVVSCISLIMCIGFSVDFSAHISYAYMNVKKGTPEERLRASLYNLGLPIAQGAVSTILGVFSLILVPSYIHNTFFKSIVLVMIIAAAHGLLILPVLLSLFGPESPKFFRKKDCQQRGKTEVC